MTKSPGTIIKLLVFTRYPVAGQAKTRLVPALGPDGAARLHRRLSERVLQTVRQFQAENQAIFGIATTIRICFTGAAGGVFRAWLGNDLEYQRQAEGDLGHRLTRALELAFQPRLASQSGDGLECGILPQERRTGEETEMAMVLGTDLSDLTPAILHQAVGALRNHDLVLGPAHDGGYYLLGLKKPHPEIFRDIAWGSARVREQTLAAATHLNLSFALLPPLVDIDRPEDLVGLESSPDFAEIFGRLPLLSVIIPTLNEAAGLTQTLEQLRHRAQSSPEQAAAADLEVIVVDGGSQDGTREIAARAGAVVLTPEGGRAARLNAGAAQARGTSLLFLHADSLPPPDYPNLIRRALADPATVAGAFNFRTDRDTPALRLINWGANLRSRLCRLPYGDQGLFLEKRVFTEMGGFTPLPIMEDFELIRRLGKRGRLHILAEPMLTSARRWRQHGVLRTWLVNQLMVLGFLIGIAPESLARFYRRGRTASRPWHRGR